MKKSVKIIAAAATTFGLVGAGSAALAAPPADRGPGNAPGVGTHTTLPTAPLSEAEKATLLRMVDEERMARDIYTAAAELYPDAPQFANTASSEQRHYDSLVRLLGAYELAVPSATVGEYSNAEVQGMYNDLSVRLTTSVDEAYAVGIAIEDADIADLKAAVTESDNVDLDTIYGNLLAGSERHLQSFANPAAHTQPLDGTGQGQPEGRPLGDAGRGNGQGAAMRGNNTPGDCQTNA